MIWEDIGDIKMKLNKKAQTGFVIRIIAGVIMTGTLPFLIVNPANVFAQIVFVFGAFLMVIGGVTP